MEPLANLDRAACRRLRGVLADIDDTLTTDGRLGSAAYTALERLRADGLLVIPVTGRPAGWCDHIARMWPVDAVVGENGAFYFAYRAADRRMLRGYTVDVAQRRANRARLDELARRILDAVPGAAIASDQAYREADLAIDFCEDVERLDPASIERIVSLFEAAGAKAKVSSIHVNGWFGDYDKLGMTRRLMREHFGVDLDAERARFVFAGDSPNDEPMFEFFPNGVGVANVTGFTARMRHLPAYVTTASCGEGFAELAAHLLEARA